MGCVYVWTNTVNGKQYVGQTVATFDVRWKGHLGDAKSRSDRHFMRAIRKYGVDAFTVEVLFESTVQQELWDREKLEIAQRGTIDRAIGYNMTAGGEGGIPRPEVRAKRSATTKLTWSNPNLRAAQSDKSKDNWADPCYRETQRAALMAGISTPEARKNKSTGLTAYWSDPVHRVTQSRRIAQVYDDPAVRAKQVAGSIIVSQARVPNVFVEGAIFRSLGEADRQLGICRELTRLRCNSTTKRFRWWHTIPNHNDPECDAVEECFALMQWAKDCPDHPNVPDWLRPDQPKHGPAPAWAKRAAA